LIADVVFDEAVCVPTCSIQAREVESRRAELRVQSGSVHQAMSFRERVLLSARYLLIGTGSTTGRTSFDSAMHDEDCFVSLVGDVVGHRRRRDI
jgi:hypothetical protein